MRTQLILATALVCALAGFFAARLSAPTPVIPETTTAGDPSECPPCEQPRNPSRPPIAPTCDNAEVTGLRQRVDQLEAKLSLQDVLLEGLSAQSQGEPVPWPAVIPPSMDPDNFRSVVQQAVGSEHNALDLVDSHCDEPPCIAVLRLPGPATGAGLETTIDAAADLLGSSTWTQQLGKEVALSHFAPFDCGERGTEWLLLTAAQVPPGVSDVSRSDLDKRVEHRAAAILEEWQCDPIDLRSIAAPR